MSSRVIFHVQHLLGVGHVVRAAAITRGLVGADLDVLLVQGGEPVPNIDFGGARTLQLPAVRAADLSFKVLLDQAGRPVDDALMTRRRDLLLEAARDFRPDVLLIEHYPFGRRKFGSELEPLIDELRDRARLAVSLRDILVERDDPKKAARVVALVRRSFDRVFVHGDRSVVDLAATFPAAAAIADRIVYTGYVVDSRPGPEAPSGDGEDEIVVSIGGGAVGETLLGAAVAAAPTAALARYRWRLLAGANLAEPAFRRLRAGASKNTVVERARPDFRSLLGRAALSISQAGYNTVMDVLAAGCRCLVVPFAGGAESEQMSRARIFEQRRLLHVLDEGALTPEALAAAAERALTEPRPKTSRQSIDLDGIAATARLIDELAHLPGHGRQ